MGGTVPGVLDGMVYGRVEIWQRHAFEVAYLVVSKQVKVELRHR